MVTISTVLKSNAQIKGHAPLSRLIAVFAGATSGIGESTLKTFVRHASHPRVYLLARSETSGERVIKECKEINKDAEIILVKVDLSSIRETDQACDAVTAKETHVDLVVLSAGEIDVKQRKTEEGLSLVLAAAYYSKMHIIQRLLPSLRASKAISRVIIVGATGYEGAVDVSDIGALKLPLSKFRPQLASMFTLALEHFAKEAPTVSFIHSFPGAVQSSLLDDLGGVFAAAALLMKLWIWIGLYFGLKRFVSIGDSGERHVFLATSERFKAKEGKHAQGVPLVDDLEVARGLGDVTGSGMYAVDLSNEKVPAKVDATLDDLRKQGVDQKIWEHLSGETSRITGRSL